MDKKVCLAITLICILFLSGCGDADNKGYVSPYKDLVVTKDENIKKYLDESRLDTDKSYTFDDAIEEFSFILYKKNLNLDDLDNGGITFSFNGNENIKLDSSGVSSYRFIYKDEDSNENVIVMIGDYTRDNYKEEAENHGYKIIREETNYIFMEQADSYSKTYYVLKFFDDGTCLEMSMGDYSSSKDDLSKQAKNFEIMKNVFETITLDDGQPFLQDKLVSIKNFDGKNIISYEYINGVNVYEKSINLKVDSYYLTVDYDNPYYYSDEKWKILDNEHLYILINSDKLYKIVVNGVPEYYLFERLSEEYTTVAMGEMLEDLYILLDIFYE